MSSSELLRQAWLSLFEYSYVSLDSNGAFEPDHSMNCLYKGLLEIQRFSIIDCYADV